MIAKVIFVEYFYFYTFDFHRKTKHINNNRVNKPAKILIMTTVVSIKLDKIQQKQIITLF